MKNNENYQKVKDYLINFYKIKVNQFSEKINNIYDRYLKVIKKIPIDRDPKLFIDLITEQINEQINKEFYFYLMYAYPNNVKSEIYPQIELFELCLCQTKTCNCAAANQELFIIYILCNNRNLDYIWEQSAKEFIKILNEIMLDIFWKILNEYNFIMKGFE